MSADEQRVFTAARSELPMLYVLLGLAAIEVPVVHLLASLWSPVAAYILVALSLLAIVQIFAIIRRVRRGAVRLTRDDITILSAKGFVITLPWQEVATMKGLGFGPAPVGDDVLRAALLAHPNIAITGREELAISRFGRSIRARTVTLRVDDPDGLVASAHQLIDLGSNSAISA